MPSQSTTPAASEPLPREIERATTIAAELRNQALQSALTKRRAGVPTFSVPEAAALLSVSSEHLYRLIRADAFPAVAMTVGGRQGRYVVPAQAVERLLNDSSASTSCTDVAGWTCGWIAERAGGTR